VGRLNERDIPIIIVCNLLYVCVETVFYPNAGLFSVNTLHLINSTCQPIDTSIWEPWLPYLEVLQTDVRCIFLFVHVMMTLCSFLVQRECIFARHLHSLHPLLPLPSIISFSPPFPHVFVFVYAIKPPINPSVCSHLCVLFCLPRTVWASNSAQQQ
jgi:hypothetical protein